MNALSLRRIAAFATAVSLAALSACAGLEKPAVQPLYADVNGARLAYVEEGSGAPVVLVHGSLSDLRTWDRTRALLAEHYRVIAYTQRYFGTEPWGSEWPRLKPRWKWQGSREEFRAGRLRHSRIPIARESRL